MTLNPRLATAPLYSTPSGRACASVGLIPGSFEAIQLMCAWGQCGRCGPGDWPSWIWELLLGEHEVSDLDACDSGVVVLGSGRLPRQRLAGSPCSLGNLCEPGHSLEPSYSEASGQIQPFTKSYQVT